MKYSFKQFDADFTDDTACLEFIFWDRWPDGGKCECGKTNCFYRVKNRRCYACSFCGFQLHPTAGTIFHKSETGLKSWFFAIFLMAQSRNGVAAKELQRQLCVTYKTAHRMGHKIRNLMHSGGNMLTDVVEADETYVGGKHAGKRGRGALGKTPVIGIVERRGGVVAQVMDRVTTAAAIKLIRANVAPGTTVHTDEFPIYNYLGKLGFAHAVINHGRKEYVRGRVHTNTIDGFWIQVKRSLDGTHHSVSRKYLGLYVDEFSFRYSHRFGRRPMFALMLERAGEQLSQAA